MHIQFLGLPASGKTTIVHALARKNPNLFFKGKKVYSSFFKMLIFNPILALKCVNISLPILLMCLKALKKSNLQLPNRYIAIFGLFVNIGNFILEKNKSVNNSKIILWDELFFQRFLSIFVYDIKSPDSSQISKYINWVNDKFSVKTILILSDLDVAKKRLFKRGLPNRMEKFDKNIINKIIHNQLMALHKINDISNFYLTINSKDEVNYNVNLITSKLKI